MRCEQQVEIGEALAAADDLAVALGREHVDAERELGPLRIRLHVERLDRRRIAVHAAPAGRTARDSAVSSGPPKSPPHSNGSPFSCSIFDRLVVGDARERRLHRLELRGVALEHLQLAAAACSSTRATTDDDQPLGELHHVVERRRTPSRARPSRTRSGGGASSTSRRGTSGRSSRRGRAPSRWLRCRAGRSASGTPSRRRSTATGNSVVVPSHAAGVKIGVSARMKPRR